MRAHLAQQDVQPLGGEAVHHEHRLCGRVGRVLRLREACPAEQVSDRLRKVVSAYAFDAHTHANEHGFERICAFSALRIVKKYEFTRFCHSIHLFPDFLPSHRFTHIVYYYYIFLSRTLDSGKNFVVFFELA